MPRRMGFFLYLLPKQKQMKSRILSAAVAAFLLFSCGTQKSAVVSVTPSAPATTVETTTAIAVTPELTPALLEGRNLYENNCSGCHKLYAPKKFTQEEWKPILVRMQKKAHVDDTQITSISNYITSQL